MSKDKANIQGLLLVFIISFAIYKILLAIPTGISWFSYDAIVADINTKFSHKLMWLLGDFTEPYFYKSFLGGLFTIIGATIAYSLLNKNSKYAGFPVAYSKRMFPRILLGQLIALALSIFVFNFVRFINADTDWVPTFIPVASITPALILVFGASIKKIITSAFFGALLGFPMAYFSKIYIIDPLGFYGVMSNVIPMWLGGIIAFEICKHLPWMVETDLIAVANNDVSEEVSAKNMDYSSACWFLRRMLADFTEPLFYGNEMAGIFLILGTIINYILIPDGVCYGNGLFPAILAGQILTSGIGIFLWQSGYEKFGSFPTFVPIVSVTPTVIIVCGPSIKSILIAAFLGALLAPPLADTINKLNSDMYPPVIGNTLSMFIATPIAVWIALAFF